MPLIIALNLMITDLFICIIHLGIRWIGADLGGFNWIKLPVPTSASFFLVSHVLLFLTCTVRKSYIVYNIYGSSILLIRWSESGQFQLDQTAGFNWIEPPVPTATSLFLFSFTYSLLSSMPWIKLWID